ncbi:MAG: iron-containing alcohol dehydrogenase [Candidatus Coproplasma sp.]
MYDFEYYAPTKVAFGKTSEEKLAGYIRETGCKKVLLHYGSSSAEKSGVLAVARSALKEAGVEFVELGGVQPNPRLSLINKGIALCREQGVDFILAVGGGSVIDSAKAIGYGVYNGGDVWDFYVGKRKPCGCLPLGVVLTLAAAGSEMSNSSVITNEEGWLKRGCNTNYVRPKFAILNPELTLTLSPWQTACGCTDILMHTMERYFTNGGNMQLTDALAEALMRTVIANARLLKANPDNIAARSEIMWASSLSHNGLTGCGNDGGDWAVHGIEHELSGLYDVAHGAGLAAIWGAWARYVYKDCLNRFHLFAVQVMGVRPSGTREELALRGIEEFEEFLHSIGMPTTLSELGIHPTDADYHRMACQCAQTGGGVKGSAKKLYEADIYNILKNAE